MRPWGFWKPIHEMVVNEDPSFVANKRFKLDMFNVVLGNYRAIMPNDFAHVLVLWMKLPLLITVLILAVIIIILKKTWWNKLED